MNLGRAGEPHLCDPATNNIGSTGIVGGSVPLAAGAALAAQLRGTDQVSVSFFGDGALNQGVMFEVLNMAAIWFPAGGLRLRGQPLRRVHRERDSDGRGTLPGPRRRLRDSVGHPGRHGCACGSRGGCAGGGPGATGRGTEFPRIRNLPFSPATTSATSRNTRTARRCAPGEARDPIPNYARWLADEGHADDAVIARIHSEIDDEVETAAKVANAMPHPGPEDLGRYLYA